MSTTVAFSVAPLGTGESVAPSVARAVKVVRESGLPNETSAMFTTVEGEWEEVMDVVKRAVAAAGEGASRVSFTIKGDIREGVTDALHEKVEAVERELGNL
ncbi:MTH1187 family thiamine-binding protein [Nocardiopsis sp. ATB16-24]|uniref:MTH1187 family thiamine-binding protein n=1 Tax=Nocardiopsis sp. ATB16-24 TaxID=3019555 RepID=UPI002555E2FB|nr:MTH1187 family thiamine-binding protein [Nocardiopsis sp. ATB16-24]